MIIKIKHARSEILKSEAETAFVILYYVFRNFQERFGIGYDKIAIDTEVYYE